MPIRSEVEPVHFATLTCAGIPVEELLDADPSTDVGEPYSHDSSWTQPRWWLPVWFRELPSVRDFSDAELEHEVMRYAIERMRG